MSERGHIAEPPVGCRVSLVDSSADRLVLSIPGGGPKTRSLGVMALVWNTFTLGAVGLLIAMSAEFSIILIGIPFLTLFVVAGLYLVGSWFSLKFTRTHLLFTPGAMAMQKILLFHKQIDQTDLDSASHARLLESYSQDGKAVFQVRVNGIQQTLAFGTALSREDKDWLVESICNFLGHEVLPALRSKAKEKELPFEECAPSELPTDSFVHVSESDPETLSISTATAPRGPLLVGLCVMLLFVALMWCGLGAGKVLLANGVMDEIMGWTFVVISTVPLVVLLVLLRGTTTVTITDRAFSTRVHLGPLGWTVKRPAGSAERISLTATSDEPSESTLATTIVQLGSSKLLAAWGSLATCRQVAGLVRYQFRSIGIETACDLEPGEPDSAPGV